MEENKINILIVEDDKSHADLISRSFESATTPVSVTCTCNLNEARASIAETVPNMVIADYLLPDGKGTELIPANKEEHPYPIVIMTSHGDEKVAVAAMKAGAFDYVVKSEGVLDDMPNVCEKILLEWNYTIRHKRVEKELKESEARFHSLLVSLYESAIVIYDRDGIVTALWGTPEMDKRYGLRAVDAIGRSIREIVPPEQAEQRLAEIKRVFDEGEKMLVEYMVSLPGGSFWHETSLSPVRDTNDNITAVVGFIRDVTGRRSTEGVLHFTRFTVDNNADAIYWVKSNAKISYANKVACRTLGYSYEELICMRVPDIDLDFPDESWPVHWQEMKDVGTLAFEAHHKTKTGFVFPVEIHATYLDYDGEEYICAFVRNITKRKKTEEKIRKLSHAIEQSSSSVIITDIKGNIEYANPKFTQLTGYGIEEAIGKTPRILKSGKIPPEVYKELWDTITSGNEWRGEFCNRKKNGELYWESVSISPVKDEKNVITNFIAVKDDITERKQIDEELKESEYRLKEAQHIAEIGSWEYNLENKQIKWSDEQYRIFGYEPNEIEPTFEKLLDVIHPDDRKVFLEKNQRCIDEGDEYSNEYRIIIPGGSERIIHSQAKLICNDSGNMIRMSGTVRDITEQKKMEETLLQSEKLKSLGEITAGVAHEFNNILAVVMGSAEVLEGGFKDDQELKRGLKAIIEAGEDGAGIVKRMLSFAKAELSESDYISIDIKYLIKQAMEFTMPRWKNMAQSEGIKYNINMVGIIETPEVFCNPTELREVFVNLIHNSIDAMPDGGVITMATRCVEHGGELKGDFIEITFSDTGKGMSEEVKRKIFDPFFTTRRPQGTGLGMSVTYGIMKRHGGKIEVESEVGKGATFTLHIPIRKEVVQRVVPSESVRKTETKKLRVLVVDDEQEICVILETFLTGKGHTVKAVNSGAEAIEQSRREDFDLVLCDLAMPEVTGYDVIKAVNELDKIPKIGISTGWGDKLKSIDEEDLKVDFLIKKPFSLSELERKISDFWTC